MNLPPGLDVRRTLVLSTAHISAQENERLAAFIDNNDIPLLEAEKRTLLGGCLDVCVIPYGYWVHCPGLLDGDQEHKPWRSNELMRDYPSLVHLHGFMAQHDITYLILDRDAPICGSDFPVYDW